MICSSTERVRVLAGFRVEHFDRVFAENHLAHVVQRDVLALLGIVESPVRVFLQNPHCTMLLSGTIASDTEAWYTV